MATKNIFAGMTAGDSDDEPEIVVGKTKTQKEERGKKNY